MKQLNNQIDTLTHTSLWLLDDALELAYSNPDWLSEAMNTEPASGLLDDIHTYYDHFEDDNGLRVTRDTGVLVEFYDDMDDVYGTGIIQSWHENVWIADEMETEYTDEIVERAYILSEDGQSSFYARVEHIRPICEVQQNALNQHEQPLPVVQDTVTAQETTRGERLLSYLRLLPKIASGYGESGGAA